MRDYSPTCMVSIWLPRRANKPFFRPWDKVFVLVIWPLKALSSPSRATSWTKSLKTLFVRKPLAVYVWHRGHSCQLRRIAAVLRVSRHESLWDGVTELIGRFREMKSENCTCLERKNGTQVWLDRCSSPAHGSRDRNLSWRWAVGTCVGILRWTFELKAGRFFDRPAACFRFLWNDITRWFSYQGTKNQNQNGRRLMVVPNGPVQQQVVDLE